MNTHIQLAEIQQLDEIIRLYRACGIELWQQGIPQWCDFYPSERIVRRDIENGHLYTLQQIEHQEIIGVVALNGDAILAYETIDWQIPAQRVLVIHRLAILPNYQGKNYAAQLMAFAENYAQTNDYQAIRLDAYSDNPKLMKFYTKLGYQRTQKEIWLEDARWTRPFACFEKKV